MLGKGEAGRVSRGIGEGKHTHHSRDNLLGDSNRVNIVWVQAVTELGYPAGDLVELDCGGGLAR